MQDSLFGSAVSTSGAVHDTLSAAYDDLVGSLYTALSTSSGSNDYYDLTNGHDFIDNSTTTHSFAADPLLPLSVLEPMVVRELGGIVSTIVRAAKECVA
jgi:hypothetical protein